MRPIHALVLGLVLCFGLLAFAQQGAAPQRGGAQQGGQPGRGQAQPQITETTVATAGDIARQTTTLIPLAPYNPRVEVRSMTRPASVHETVHEMFYVVDGAGTLVTGGKLVGETRPNPENRSGTAIEGGVTRINTEKAPRH